MSVIPIHGSPEQILAYCKAFKAMQAELGAVPKNSTAPIGSKGQTFKFADYGALVEYLRPFFDKHGFFHQATPGSSVEKIAGAEGEHLVMVARGKVVLVHEEGAYSEADYAMAAGTPRDAGAIHTYCKRYALQGLVGISSDEDTDAADIQPPQQAQKARQEPSKQQAKTQQPNDKERARAAWDELVRFLKSKSKNEKDFADLASQAGAYSLDAWESKVGVLVAKGEVNKVQDVLRWAKANIGKATALDPGQGEGGDDEAMGDESHPGHPSNYGDR